MDSAGGHPVFNGVIGGILTDLTARAFVQGVLTEKGVCAQRP